MNITKHKRDRDNEINIYDIRERKKVAKQYLNDYLIHKNAFYSIILR